MFNEKVEEKRVGIKERFMTGLCKICSLIQAK